MQKLIVALLIPEPYNSMIRREQSELKQKYGGEEVDKYPPHITLKSIGEIKDEFLEKVSDQIEVITHNTKHLDVFVEGIRFYGTNENIIGLYLNVHKTEQIQFLHDTLISELRKFEDKPREWKEGKNYNPHITVAYPDIGEKNYEKMKKEVLDWSPKFNFKANKIYILHKTDFMKSYDIFKKFEIK